jgi:Uma2 family endonuclease
MESIQHWEQMNILIDSLNVYWSSRDDYFVGGNMFLHYDPENKAKFRGPDFFLVLGVEKKKRRKSWVVWREGMRFPNLIIELLSDSMRNEDKGRKKELYEKLFKMEEYYWYDPHSQEFMGNHLKVGRYEEIEPDTWKKIYSPLTGLYLAIQGEWLRWMTPEGMILPTSMELAEQEKQRAEQEKQRADRAEQLLEEYRRRFGDLNL